MLRLLNSTEPVADEDGFAARRLRPLRATSLDDRQETQESTMTGHVHPNDDDSRIMGRLTNSQTLTEHFEHILASGHDTDHKNGALEVLAANAIARARWLEIRLAVLAGERDRPSETSGIPPMSGVPQHAPLRSDAGPADRRAIAQEQKARRDVRPLGNVYRLPVRDDAA